MGQIFVAFSEYLNFKKPKNSLMDPSNVNVTAPEVVEINPQVNE